VGKLQRDIFFCDYLRFRFAALPSRQDRQFAFRHGRARQVDYSVTDRRDLHRAGHYNGARGAEGLGVALATGAMFASLTFAASTPASPAGLARCRRATIQPCATRHPGGGK
jgi:hypothetical protein